MSAAAEPAERRIRFTADDIGLFSAASHDRNPLHLDSSYARTTQFGQPVVFGVLGGLACAGVLPPSCAVTGITLEFPGPMFPDLDYVVRLRATTDTSASVVLSEGTRPLVKASFQLGPRPSERSPLDGESPVRANSADLARADITPGTQLAGRWRPDPGALAALVDRVAPGGALTTGQVGALLWTSYLVGMEMPGRRALYSMVKLTFTDGGHVDGSVPYDVTVRAVDERFGLVRLAVNLGDVASGEVRAFVRERAHGTADVRPPTASLAGRSAFVVGASRGLGAEIARAFARRGAVVYAGSRRAADDLVDGVVQIEGDGADADWCRAVVERIGREHGGLDILACNASPTILPMWFDLHTAVRTDRYVADSLRLVTAPLAAALPSLEQRQGWAVAISSIYAETAPAGYPHYVAAKGAVEGLIRSVAHHHTKVGFLLVRPPRLLGELNIPVAGETPIGGEVVATAIADRLAAALPSGGAELLSEFAVPGS